MIKKQVYILMVALFMLLISCSDLLNKDPDFVSPDYYYDNQQQMQTALNGVYNRLIDPNGRMYSKALYSYFAISDEAFYRAVRINSIKVMQFDASNLDIGRFWEVLYDGVNRANYLLANIEGKELSTQEMKAIKGEALFLRGYYYFLLTSYFGEVPLKLTPTTSPNEKPLAKASLQNVYAQIEHDMLEAEQLVMDIDDLGTNERISKTAVQAILARVYMKMAGQPLNKTAKYQDALQYCNRVITSEKHELSSDYAQIFINHCQDIIEPKECIWEVGMYGNKLGTFDLAGSVGVENGIICRDTKIGYSGGAMQIQEKLYNAFDATDLRRDWCIAPYYYDTDETTGLTTQKFYTASQIFNRNPGKWRREYETGEKAQLYNSTNFPIIRYSDVLLMKAEAINAIKHGPDAEAYEAVNQVRRRAYGKSILVADATCDLPTGMNEATFLKSIQDERYREFCFEGIRKLDLIRWGIYVQTMNALGKDVNANGGAYAYAGNAGTNTTSRNVLFPIPNTELTVNKLMTQNPGW
ncbi:MAG: RagB/SusD family nutrient uptake outer membrane protein [Prevotella sp.]|nr:RagB/SusD family nutrient uptake outer membrane protein [Prevotella sp.]